jgi:hypothetical protein
MTLAALIRKKPPTSSATATVATLATDDRVSGGSVATVATVAVANPETDKSSHPRTVATVATVAVAGLTGGKSGENEATTAPDPYPQAERLAIQAASLRDEHPDLTDWAAESLATACFCTETLPATLWPRLGGGIRATLIRGDLAADWLHSLAQAVERYAKGGHV